MRLREQLSRTWREDPLLQKLVRNTSYLFSGSMASTGLASAQVFLATLLLGAAEYGTLHIILDFASNVNRLLSFRMGELVIKYAGQSVAGSRKDEAAAIVKAAALAEVITAVIAFALLWLLSPLASDLFLESPAFIPWIRIYGLALLANMLTETTVATLQLGNHYRSQAALLLGQNLITFVGIGAAFLLKGDMVWVLLSYLAGKFFYGFGLIAASLHWMPTLLSPGWWRVPFSRLSAPKELARFAFSTNLSATINLLVRDSELLWVGFLLSPLQAGYYKLALSLMSLMLLPINPFIQTTFPEISQAVGRRAWGSLRNMLKQTSTIAAVWTLICFLGLLIFGGPFLNWYKGGEYAPAYLLMLVLILGFGTANIFFWSRPLLLAFGLPDVPLKINAFAGGLKTILMLVLVRPFGYLMQGALMAAYFIVTVGWIVLRGLHELRQRETITPEGMRA